MKNSKIKETKKANTTTIANIMNNVYLNQVQRSFYIRELILKHSKMKDCAKKRSFFTSLIGCTLPLTPMDFSYLCKCDVFKVIFCDEGGTINYNRNPNDWSDQKNTAGFFESLYKDASRPISERSSAYQFGMLNNFIIRIFWSNDTLYCSIEDGGHRTVSMCDLCDGKEFKTIKEGSGTSKETADFFNNYIVGHNISSANEDDPIFVLATQAILPITFAHESFSATARNRTKPHNNNDAISLDYKDNVLWLRTKAALSGMNKYNTRIVFDKGSTNNTIAALFIASKLLGYFKSSKYDGIRYILENYNSQEYAEKVVNLVVEFYMTLFCNEKTTFLRKPSGYYHTYRVQATIHALQGATLHRPTVTKVYRKYATEYKKRITRGDVWMLDGGTIKSFRDFFEAIYCGYRKKSTVEAHMLLAEDTVDYINKVLTRIEKNANTIDYILAENNTFNGSGHSDCDKKAITLLLDCFINGNWKTYSFRKNNSADVLSIDTNSKKKSSKKGGTVNA